jgi:hypothetical protein
MVKVAGSDGKEFPLKRDALLQKMNWANFRLTSAMLRGCDCTKQCLVFPGENHSMEDKFRSTQPE